MADKASEIAKNIWLAGLGAYGKAFDEAQGRLDKAIEVFGRAVEFDDALVYDEPEPLPFAARHWLGAGPASVPLSSTCLARRSAARRRLRKSSMVRAFSLRARRP